MKTSMTQCFSCGRDYEIVERLQKRARAIGMAIGMAMAIERNSLSQIWNILCKPMEAMHVSNACF